MKVTLAALFAVPLGLFMAIAALPAVDRPAGGAPPVCPLALAGSSYGQLLARLAKNKLNVLHHGGQARLANAEIQPAAARPRRLIGRPVPQPATGPNAALVVDWKRDWIDQMLSAKVRRTNPNPITAINLKYVNREMGGNLETAYAMDPTDYSIYNSYFMYLKDNPWGSDRRKAKELALRTLKHCEKENESPAPPITAAAAALDLVFIAIEDARSAGQEPPGRLVSLPPACQGFLHQANQNLSAYEALRQRYQESGRWKNLPEQRRGELENYADFVMRQLRQIKDWEEKKTLGTKPAS